MRDPTSMVLIRDALMTLTDTDSRVIRVIGNPVQDGGLLIEVTMLQKPLRRAMIDYGLNILAISAAISVFTALLLFFAVRMLMVHPIKGVVDHMKNYADAPEDARRIIDPKSSVKELRDAEEALFELQKQLTGSLKQKERLAQLGGAVAKVSHDLGGAVAKVSHDLRNILTSAQLFTDRIESSDDPLVKRMAPKLVGSITRAVNLCETTLAFGRVDEPAPTLSRVNLSGIISDVVESEKLAAEDHPLTIKEIRRAPMSIRADLQPRSKRTPGHRCIQSTRRDLDRSRRG